ncbi:hypothetical protein M422DRAFT_52988 [Sphaerobolus stellatus SS14]|uniref:Uncharacterized protein n=1 Tax=Sphaerobolus stellatus (strain SS14) TaxID=990650 RepID=A0A0C9V3X1_SPHS4|nr:hypothetical protein M422DRAFT_52988 [Sphaerobolus stellatus SS14]
MDGETLGMKLKPIRTIDTFMGPVKKLDFNLFHQRLAVVGEGQLKVWEIDTKGSISVLMTELSVGFIAKTVHFFNKCRAVLVGYLESHSVLGQSCPGCAFGNVWFLARQECFISQWPISFNS